MNFMREAHLAVYGEPCCRGDKLIHFNMVKVVLMIFVNHAMNCMFVDMALLNYKVVLCDLYSAIFISL